MRELTFAPDDFQIAVNFSVVDDEIALEPTEILNWNLELVTLLDRVSISPFNGTLIQIIDNDGTYVNHLLLVMKTDLHNNYMRTWLLFYCTHAVARIPNTNFLLVFCLSWNC